MSHQTPPPIPKLPPPAPPPLPGPPKRVTLAQSKSTGFWEMLFRGITVLVILAALAVAWWSLFEVWFPLQKQSQELTSRLSRVSDENDQMERKWSKDQIVQIRGQFNEVRSQLFGNESAFNDWLRDLRTSSDPLGLKMKVDLGSPSPAITNSHDLALVPANISVEISPEPEGRAESPYQRLLRLTESIAHEGKRADLTEMTVNGGPKSVSRAVLGFRLWASEKELQ